MVVVGICGWGLLHIVGSGMGEWGNEDMRTEWLEFLPADLTHTHTHTHTHTERERLLQVV